MCVGKGDLAKERAGVYKAVSGHAAVGVSRPKCRLFSGKCYAGSRERNADHVSGTGSDSPGMEVYDPSDEDES